MTVNPPECTHCGTELREERGTPTEWYCDGPCPRDQILWRTSTGGKMHTNVKCKQLQDAERQHTQRNADLYDKRQYCSYCLDDIADVPSSYQTLAGTIKAADDPEQAVGEFFGGDGHA